MKKAHIVILIIISICVISIVYPNRLRIFRSFYFIRLDQHLYVSKNTSDIKIKQLRKILNASYQKNAAFWLKDFKQVDVYYTDEKPIKDIFSNSSDLATFIATPLYNFIIINEKGLDENVISHEICHAIFFNNLGSFKWYKQKYVIPIWFDEGLALQLDDRADYKLNTLSKPRNMNVLSYLKTKDSDAIFYNINSVYDNYMLSKFQVHNWLRNNEINEFISKVRVQNDFYKVYDLRNK